MKKKYLTVVDENNIWLNCGVDGIANISLDKIKSVEKVSRSSFRHPILGFIVAILLISISVGFVSISEKGIHSPEGWFINYKPIGFGLIIFFFMGFYLFIKLVTAEKIPWILIKTSSKNHILPINDETEQEVEELLNIVRNYNSKLIL